MDVNGEDTNGSSTKFAGKNGIAKALQKQKPPWRIVAPSADVRDALEDFRDLCFRPPEDPAEPNGGDRGGNTPAAGEALAALEPLYDPDRMRQAMKWGVFRNGVDVVRQALAALMHMQDAPERHLYKPLDDEMPPAREANISLERVLVRLLSAVQSDFRPEVEIIRRECHDRIR